MTRYVLAIDGGSQSTKVSVVDEVGQIVAVGRAPLRAYDLGPEGGAVHPGDDLWEALIRACRQAVAALAALGGEVSSITGIGLCGIRFCRVYADKRGALTEPVLSWMDARVSRPVEVLDPEVATITSAGGYLAIRLTGERRDTAGNFLGAWPLDVMTRSWSGIRAEELGMPLDHLPELVEPGGQLGRLTPEAAAALGLPEGCPVIATGNDKAVEALGAGLIEPGRALLSLGTYIAAMSVGEAEAADDDRWWLNIHSVPGAYLRESAGIRRGMWTISWLRSLVTSGVATPVDEADVLARLEHGAENIAPGCGGLLIVPDFLAPRDKPFRRGVMLGLTGEHDERHLFRAVLEGIALTMRRNLAAMGEALGEDHEEIIVSGGGSRSDLMMQIVADSFGRPARRPEMPDAAGLGSAICAAVGTGIYASFPEAVAAMVGPGTLYRPGRHAETYRALARRYDALPDLLDPVLAALADF